MMLQNTFYIIGIICMTLYTLLLIAIVVLLFYIKKKISDVSKNVEEKIREVKEIVSHPKEVAASVGAAVADTALHQAAKMMKSHHKR